MSDNTAKLELRGIHLLDTIAACNEQLGETNEDAAIDAIRDSQRRMDDLRGQMAEEAKMYDELMALLVGLTGSVTKTAKLLGVARVTVHRHVRPLKKVYEGRHAGE